MFPIILFLEFTWLGTFVFKMEEVMPVRVHGMCRTLIGLLEESRT
jgi:hypothetical protein